MFCGLWISPDFPLAWDEYALTVFFFIFGWTNPFLCKMLLKKRHRDLLSPSVCKVWLKSPAALFCSTHLLCCVNPCDSYTPHVLPISFSYGTLSTPHHHHHHHPTKSSYEHTHLPISCQSLSDRHISQQLRLSLSPLLLFSNASLDLIRAALSGSPNTSQRLTEYFTANTSWNTHCHVLSMAPHLHNSGVAHTANTFRTHCFCVLSREHLRSALGTNV